MDFPEPEGPTTAVKVPRATVEVEVAEHLDLALAVAEALRDVAERDHGRGFGSLRPSTSRSTRAAPGDELEPQRDGGERRVAGSR